MQNKKKKKATNQKPLEYISKLVDMTTLKSILVVGPTGAVGFPLCQELIRNKQKFARIAGLSNTSRSASTEKEAKLADLRDKGMEIVPGRYTDVEAFRGFDAVIMTLGNFANHLQPEIIDSAIQAGVRHFYPSEFGADITVGDNWNQRYYRDKVTTRKHLMNRAEQVDGLGWTYITIGRFTEWATTSYFGVDNQNHSAAIYGTEVGKQSLISLPNCLTYTVRTLSDPFDSSDASSRQRTYRFHGESLDWAAIFAMLGRITGSSYAVTYKPTEEALTMSREAERLKDDKLAMNASHRVVQGSQGTLLPVPWDNDRFPEVRVDGVEEVLMAMYNDPGRKEWYGI